MLSCYLLQGRNYGWIEICTVLAFQQFKPTIKVIKDLRSSTMPSHTIARRFLYAHFSPNANRITRRASDARILYDEIVVVHNSKVASLSQVCGYPFYIDSPPLSRRRCDRLRTQLRELRAARFVIQISGESSFKSLAKAKLRVLSMRRFLSVPHSRYACRHGNVSYTG